MFYDIYKTLILLIFFFNLNSLTYGSENKDFYKEKYCEEISPEFFLSNTNPDKIIIETNNKKKWTKNIFSLLVESNFNKYKTKDSRWNNFQINKKFKKKFTSKVTFEFNNYNLRCSSKAKISIRGNLWFHLDWEKGYPFSSLEVELENGNINNQVKFNLLIPNSRVNPNQILNKNFSQEGVNTELFVTGLFNKLNLLAPKSYMVNVEINGNKREYLFQETLTKEFLESRRLVEGPIITADHRFTTDNIFKWRGELALAKIENSSYYKKSLENENLAFNVLSFVNNIFVNNTSQVNNNYDRCYSHYLSLKKNFLRDEKEIKNNLVYEAIIFATETEHSLACDDRRFYFDPVKKLIFPIYNDGKSNINLKTNDISNNIKNLSVTANAVEGARQAKSLLDDIDSEKFYYDLKKNGFNLSKEKFYNLLNKVKNNLNALVDLENTIQVNKINPITNANYFSRVEDNYDGKTVKLTFFDENKKVLKVCNFRLSFCEEKKVQVNNEKNYLDLLSQDFKNLKKNILDKKYEYLFLSTYNNIDLKGAFEQTDSSFNKIKINNQFFIEHNESVKVSINNEKKIISLKMLNSDGRTIVSGNEVEAWTFNLSGLKLKNNQEIRNFNNLTGCLTFIDTKVNNIKLISDHALCEDAFNFIRVNGNIKYAEAIYSYSDSLDFDFSNVEIKEALIKYSGNDCADFSYGVYTIQNIKMFDCGDKGISVGEKSKLSISNAFVSNQAQIGLAAKDSSLVLVKNSEFYAKTCLASYRKKQEFLGAIIKYKNIYCHNNKFLKQKNSQIIEYEF